VFHCVEEIIDPRDIAEEAREERKNVELKKKNEIRSRKVEEEGKKLAPV
jgi:hypothetical protein